THESRLCILNSSLVFFNYFFHFALIFSTNIYFLHDMYDIYQLFLYSDSYIYYCLLYYVSCFFELIMKQKEASLQVLQPARAGRRRLAGR
ncbi:MAG: hypothetical protein PF436_03245, partial [Prolixibacteraceae bacterium]|nr:hypothetical protein [Prolixibacteraceae bacterium]